MKQVDGLVTTTVLVDDEFSVSTFDWLGFSSMTDRVFRLESGTLIASAEEADRHFGSYKEFLLSSEGSS